VTALVRPVDNLTDSGCKVSEFQGFQGFKIAEILFVFETLKP
jgi:hypothetical protein